MHIRYTTVMVQYHERYSQLPTVSPQLYPRYTLIQLCTICQVCQLCCSFNSQKNWHKYKDEEIKDTRRKAF